MLPVTSMQKAMSTAYLSPLAAAGAWPGGVASPGDAVSCSVISTSVLHLVMGRTEISGVRASTVARTEPVQRSGGAVWTPRTGSNLTGTTGRGLGPARRRGGPSRDSHVAPTQTGDRHAAMERPV